MSKLLDLCGILSLRILMTLVSQPSLLIKFRSGNCNGHWLLKSDIVLQNKMIKALGQQVWSLLHFFSVGFF